MKKGLLILLFLPSLVLSQKLKDLSNDTIGDLKWGYEYFMPTSTCGEIIKYNNYSVSFCEKYRLSEWAIYYKDASVYTSIYSRKGLYFKRDPNLNGRDGGNEWYYKNIYDKGHLVPAAHMNDNYESLKETFLFTNCTPQHESFNRGGMKELERKIRQWNNEFGRVAVITGWVIEESLDLLYNGAPPYMPIPKYYYKVFVDISNNRSIAFLIPNEKITKTLMEYVVSIDYLESVTGLDFFYKLPKDIERSFEIDTGDKN
jgi:endonuclease G